MMMVLGPSTFELNFKGFSNFHELFVGVKVSLYVENTLRNHQFFVLDALKRSLLMIVYLGL